MVQFQPTFAFEYNQTFNVDLQGLSKMLPINLVGVGVGPKLLMTFDTLNAGEILLNTIHQYDLEI